MAFIATNSKIEKTHWHTSAHVETFTECGGHSYRSFKKKIKLDKFGHRRQFDLKKSKTSNAYSAFLDDDRTKIPLPSERSKSPLSFRQRKMSKSFKIV